MPAQETDEISDPRVWLSMTERLYELIELRLCQSLELVVDTVCLHVVDKSGTTDTQGTRERRD
jgi:hypothetical protein